MAVIAVANPRWATAPQAALQAIGKSIPLLSPSTRLWSSAQPSGERTASSSEVVCPHATRLAISAPPKPRLRARCDARTESEATLQRASVASAPSPLAATAPGARGCAAPRAGRRSARSCASGRDNSFASAIFEQVSLSPAMNLTNCSVAGPGGSAGEATISEQPLSAPKDSASRPRITLG